MSLRSPRERFLQTLMFEAGGLCLSIPLYMLAHQNGAGESAALMALLTVGVMLWSPLHNTVFDRVDLALTGRVASARPKALRVCHALSHEVSAVAVSLPIMVGFGGHSVAQALCLNVGLTALYTVYAFLFHLVYDRVRPVAPGLVMA